MRKRNKDRKGKRQKENEKKRERNKEDLFGLVALFNGVATFVGYLMPKPSLKNSSDTI